MNFRNTRTESRVRAQGSDKDVATAVHSHARGMVVTACQGVDRRVVGRDASIHCQNFFDLVVQGVGDKDVTVRIDNHAIGIAESTAQGDHRGIVAGCGQLIESLTTFSWSMFQQQTQAQTRESCGRRLLSGFSSMIRGDSSGQPSTALGIFPRQQRLAPRLEVRHLTSSPLAGAARVS